MIVISVFAVFGLYALVREICRALGSRNRFILGYVPSDAGGLPRFYEEISEAADLCQNDFRFRTPPVILLSKGEKLSAELCDAAEELHLTVYREISMAAAESQVEAPEIL